MKLHVFGPSGSGVSTLGKALAERYQLLWLDSDDYYWQKTDPPYTSKNPIPVRWQLMEAAMKGRDSWIISGSMDSWSEPFIEQFDLVIFLEVPNEICVARIGERERLRHGTRILPGGDMYEQSQEFLEWATHYEDNTREGRNRERHEAWMNTLPCPVLRIAGVHPVGDLVERVGLEIKRLGLAEA